jgi:hypothetical protein
MPERANVGQHCGTHLRERTCERKCQNYYLTRQTVIVRNAVRNSAVGVIYDKKPRQIFEHKTDHVNGEFMRKNDNELRGL